MCYIILYSSLHENQGCRENTHQQIHTIDIDMLFNTTSKITVVAMLL